MIYLFVRKEGFYPVEARDDNHAAEMAMHNPGTIRVEQGGNGKIVWPLPCHNN